MLKQVFILLIAAEFKEDDIMNLSDTTNIFNQPQILQFRVVNRKMFCTFLSMVFLHFRDLHDHRQTDMRRTCLEKWHVGVCQMFLMCISKSSLQCGLFFCKKIHNPYCDHYSR